MDGITPEPDCPHHHSEEFHVASYLKNMRQKLLEVPEASLPFEIPLRIAIPYL